MAKGSNNLRGKTSDASKPYDVSNSFVKRMASRVTELLPQPSSWLSRWMSPTSAPNTSDFSHPNITSRPPATSRAELNLVDNVDHVPAKKPRISCYNSPINQNKFLRTDVYNTDDISPIPVRLEPVAGPSHAHPEFIASTPAEQPQNSTKANGDDCSETSESTSGCSSLVPQAQSTARSLGGNRYGRTLPPGSNVDSLHRRRPSFSTTTFSSPLRARMRDRLGSSPFYSGRTMYGGASQAYMSSIQSPQRRIGPTVKPIPAQQSLPLSSTAKRILDALEQFSTPVMDAKRMPVVVGSKRKMEAAIQRYTELSIPSTPDLLRVKRREKLQQSTSAARQSATASEPSLQSSPTEYTIRREADRKKQTGKVKTKDQVTDEQLVEVKLPSVALHVDNLPKIDIDVPPPTSGHSLALNQPSTSSSTKFMFATPKIVLHSGTTLTQAKVSTSSFKFSPPINESGCKVNVDIDINKSVINRSVSSKSSSENITSHPKKRKSKDENISKPTENLENKRATNLPHNSENILSPAAVSAVAQHNISECKSCHQSFAGTSCSSCNVVHNNTFENDNLSTTTSHWDCSMCKNKNPSNSESCETCQTKRCSKVDSASKKKKSPSVVGFKDLYKKPLGTWECPICMIQNMNDVMKCIACEASKPSPKENKIATTTSSFGDKFKRPIGSWECQSCLVQNKSDSLNCVACTTPKLSGESSTTPKTESTNTLPKQSTVGFGNKFKKAPGSWSCEICMITNDAEKDKCVACETTKPGAVLVKKTSEPTVQKFSFGIPASLATSSSSVATKFSFGITKGEHSHSTESSILPNISSSLDKSQQALSSSQTFSFGIPKSKTEGENLSSVSTATPIFQFGSGPPQTKTSESKSSFINTVTSKQSVPDTVFRNVLKNTITESNKEATSVESSDNVISTLSSSVSTVVPTSSIGSDVKSSIQTFGLKTEKSVSDTEKTSNAQAIFTFGTNKITQNANEKSSTVNSSKITQPSFLFGSTEGNYGSNVASSTTSTISTSSSSNMFKFGETKTVSSTGDFSSIPSVNTQPSFSTTKLNNIFTFGSNTEKKEENFGSSTKDTLSTNTGIIATTENKPAFGSFTNPSPAFGNVNTFGSSNFGNKEQSANPFIPQTTSSVFGTSETTNTASTSTFSGLVQKNAFQPPSQTNKLSAVFTFGSTPSKEPSSTGGFVFNPVTEKRTEQEQSFGFSATQTNPSAPAFGFVNSTTSAPSTTFNFEPKPFGSGISSFNTTASDTPTSVFGAPSQQATTFGEQPTLNPVFAFGSQATQPSSQTSANPVFDFGSNQQQNTPVAPAPSTAFVFGATPAAPATPAFDPNIRPTFNFTQGSTPVFSAVPTVNSTGQPQQPIRKIRKAVRRTNISSVRQT